MTAPVQYVITYNFNQDEVSQITGRATIKTSELDFELANVALSITQIISALGQIQRADGALKDLIVSPESLSAATLLLIGSSLWNVRGTWLTATSYVSKDMVVDGTGTYVCVTAHTSGVFATDLAAGKWVRIYDTTNFLASNIAFTPAGNIAATDVQAALVEVDSEHLLKTANLSDVTTVSVARTNLSVLSKAEVQNQSAVYAAAAGTADVITLAPSPSVAAYAAGQKFCWVASGTNTGAVTLEISSLGAKALTKNGTVALVAGDIPIGAFVEAGYDGSRFQLISVVADRLPLAGGTLTGALVLSGDPKAALQPAAARNLTKSMFGLTYAINAGDATNDIDFAAGGAMDSTGAYFMTGAALTKQLDVVWGVGNNAGMLDTGAVGNNEYYLWEIARSDTGVVDYLASLSPTAPTMPTNYNFKRLMGYLRRLAGVNTLFDVYESAGGGIYMQWRAPTLDITLANTLTTARRTDAVKVPTSFSVEAHLNVLVNDVAFQVSWIYCPDQTDAAPSRTAAPLCNLINTAASPYGYQIKIRTSAAGLVAARSDLATVDLYAVSTMGFNWDRRN